MPSRSMSNRSASVWYVISAATGLDAGSTRPRTCCILAALGDGAVLRPGMFFTVEPMVNAGRPEVKVLDDGWTAVTRDRSLSAQFEHMVGVTEDGVEVFTHSPVGLTKPPYA